MNDFWKESLVKIVVKKLPNNCWECPFWLKNEVRISDNICESYTHQCPFGCTWINSALKRVEGCPLVSEE